MRITDCVGRQALAEKGRNGAYDGCRGCLTGQMAMKGLLNDWDVDYLIKHPECEMPNDRREEENMKLKLEPAPEGMKRCARCKDPKPANKENFGKDGRAKDGFRGYCRKCDSIVAKEGRLKRLGRLPNKPDVPEPAGPIYLSSGGEKSKIKTILKGTGNQSQYMNLDFSQFPDVVAKIAELAAQELRSPENQAVWMLKEFVAISR